MIRHIFKCMSNKVNIYARILAELVNKAKVVHYYHAVQHPAG